MIEPDAADVTRLLQRMHGGEVAAKEQLLKVLYRDLHDRARLAMRNQPKGHTLQPTALVNEAYLRLVGRKGEGWADRTHFLSVAARAMRQILVDHARGKNRIKRKSSGEQVPLENLVVSYEDRAMDLAALDTALDRLAEFDPTMARAVELRFFGGLEVQEVADAVDMSKRTFERKWQATRAWLLGEMR